MSFQTLTISMAYNRPQIIRSSIDQFYKTTEVPTTHLIVDVDGVWLGHPASGLGLHPDGPRRVPASAVQRVSDDSVVLLPQRYGGAGLHLCVDNRGGPAASLSLGALTLSLPADAKLWSASVGGRAVQPASTAEGQVLIPLVRSQATG